MTNKCSELPKDLFKTKRLNLPGSRSAALRNWLALIRNDYMRCAYKWSDAMADVQVTLSLPALRTGVEPETGPTVVKHLQLMLNQRGGFPILVEDGDFGPSTEASVKHYQQNENLTVDGVVGKQTWTSLLSKWLLQSEPG